MNQQNQGLPTGMDEIPAARDQLTVQVDLNQTYRAASGRDLHVHVIRPGSDPTWTSDEVVDAERFPCLVFVQGSGWAEQSMGTMIDFFCRFARRGYVVALVEYRPSDVAPFPAQVIDAKQAVRFMRANAHRFHVDPDQMVMAGDSSGGHTAVMVHVTQGTNELDVDGGEPLNLRATVEFFAPVDFARMDEGPGDHTSPASPEGKLLGGIDVARAPQDVLDQVSPLTRISLDRPLVPLFIAHGTADSVVPFTQSLILHDALKQAGQPVTMLAVTDADHGLPAFFSPELADRVDAFLRKVLGQ